MRTIAFVLLVQVPMAASVPVTVGENALTGRMGRGIEQTRRAVALMASDVAAYPERVPELLERWCSRRWAEDIVVTMKFTGEAPDFDTVDEARRVAAAHGYRVRAKHFFNNKNELEIMLRL